MRDIKTLIGMLEDLKTKLKKYKEDDSGTYSFYEDLQYHLNSIPIEPPVKPACENKWKFRLQYYAIAVNRIDDFFEYRYKNQTPEQIKEYVMSQIDNITKQLSKSV